MFSISIEGRIKSDDAAQVEAIEQSIANDLRDTLGKYAEHFDLAGGQFDYSGSIDLLPHDGSPDTAGDGSTEQPGPTGETPDASTAGETAGGETAGV